MIACHPLSVLQVVSVAVTKSRILIAVRRREIVRTLGSNCGVINELSSQTKISEIKAECYLQLSMRMVTDKGSNKVS